MKLIANDGKFRTTDCSNTEGLFRIIQSIPSKKAEPFKLWLAKVGYERIQEIEDPELAQNRARSYFELKDYPKEWIEKRLRVEGNKLVTICHQLRLFTSDGKKYLTDCSNTDKLFRIT